MTACVSGRFSLLVPSRSTQVGDRVEPEPVHAHVEPEAHDADHRLQHLGIVEIEVRLVAEEAVPVERLGDRIPGPVGRLGVGEDDARIGVLGVGVAPDVEIALGGTRRRAPRRLEPGVLVRGVVHHQFGDHAQAAPVRLAHQRAQVVAGAVLRVHVAVVGNVVAVVLHRRGIEGQQPDGVHAQVAHVVELFDQPGEIAQAVAVGVEERLDVQLVDDGVLVPERVAPGRPVQECFSAAFVGRAIDRFVHRELHGCYRK